jgi:hypothetical protein
VKLIRGTWNDTEYLTRLKRVRLSLHDISYIPHKHAFQKLVREGTVWSGLQHPQITPFFGVCFDLDRPGIPSLVCPYYKNGDITTYIQAHPEADRLNLVNHVAIYEGFWMSELCIILGHPSGCRFIVPTRTPTKSCNSW